MNRRAFVTSGAVLGALAGLDPRRAAADVAPHLWQGHDFGPGPRPADRLNQGPFDIDQDGSLTLKLKPHGDDGWRKGV
jgi:hypothetical protein